MDTLVKGTLVIIQKITPGEDSQATVGEKKAFTLYETVAVGKLLRAKELSGGHVTTEICEIDYKNFLLKTRISTYTFRVVDNETDTEFGEYKLQ